MTHQAECLEYRLLYFLDNLVEIGLFDTADFAYHVALNVTHQQLALHVTLLAHGLGQHLVRESECVLRVVALRRNHTQINVTLILLQLIVRYNQCRMGLKEPSGNMKFTSTTSRCSYFIRHQILFSANQRAVFIFEV